MSDEEMARRAKEAARKAIESHDVNRKRLAEAWEFVAREDAALASAKGAIDTYHAVSASELLAGVELTGGQLAKLRERIARWFTDEG